MNPLGFLLSFMTNKWISRRECLLLFKKNKEEKEGRREKKQEWEKERENESAVHICKWFSP